MKLFSCIVYWYFSVGMHRVAFEEGVNVTVSKQCVSFRTFTNCPSRGILFLEPLVAPCYGLSWLDCTSLVPRPGNCKAVFWSLLRQVGMSANQPCWSLIVTRLISLLCKLYLLAISCLLLPLPRWCCKKECVLLSRYKLEDFVHSLFWSFQLGGLYVMFWLLLAVRR